LSLHVGVASTCRDRVIGDILLLLTELLASLVPSSFFEYKPDIA